MDFLDPKRKKAHRHRLLVGYLLIAVAISMGTLILLFTAYGYDVNRKTGDVIQNGTVFVDSKPVSSLVKINGQVQKDRTSARFALPGSQQYVINLSQDGYREWNRTFSLEGGKIERITYPLLIPNKLTTKEIQLYSSAPGVSTQSPDRRWLLIQQPSLQYTFDLYDLNDPTSNSSILTIPNNILTSPERASTLKFVKWASDNRHVLVERNYLDKKEYLMLDISAMTSSININNALTVAPSEVSLKDNKADQLYIYDSLGGTLRIGDTKNRTVSGAVLNNVLAYKSLGDEIILYATTNGAAEGKINIRVRENDKASYLLRTIKKGGNLLLDVSESDGSPFFVAGSNVDNTVFVYRDPLPSLKGQRQTALLVSTVFRLYDPKFVSFSDSNLHISVQSGNKLLVYDIAGDRQFKIDLKHETAENEKIQWMDGYRFSYVEKGIGHMIDFDGSNDQAIVPSVTTSNIFYTADKKLAYSVAPSTAVAGRYSLTQTPLEVKN